MSRSLIELALLMLLVACRTSSHSKPVASVVPRVTSVEKHSTVHDRGSDAKQLASAEVAAGRDHTCARKTDGTVLCWGANAFGQLGDGTKSDRYTPVAVAGLKEVVEVAAGHDHSCARKTDGTILCWGANGSGQLGDGTTTDHSSPVDESTDDGFVALKDTAEVAVGTAHTCVRKTDGTVLCWGVNSSGQLGDDSTTDHASPAVVEGLKDVAKIAAGDGHTCASKTDGTVLCWGWNKHGQLGDGTTRSHSSPLAVAGLENVADIAAGGRHTCARRMDGTLLCWGDNSSGQLGDGTTRNHSSPVAVAGLENVAEVAVGTAHTCARKTDGTVLCWGDNSRGQLGDGTTRNHHSPVAVAGLGDVAEVAAGWDHTCARKTDGAVLCWGDNGNGQLGDGATTPDSRNRPTDHSSPVAVAGLKGTAAQAEADLGFRLFTVSQLVTAAHPNEMPPVTSQVLTMLGLTDAQGLPDATLVTSFNDAYVEWARESENRTWIGEEDASKADAYWAAHKGDHVRRWTPSGWQ